MVNMQFKSLSSTNTGMYMQQIFKTSVRENSGVVQQL